MIFLENAGPALLVVHALLAMALAGSTGHLVVVSVARLRGRTGNPGRHLRIAGGVYLVCFVVGLLMYPHYRYHVRGLYLDGAAPWASNLFDIKENLAALLLPLGVAFAPIDGRFPRVAAALGVLLGLGVLTLLIAGVLVTNTKGV